MLKKQTKTSQTNTSQNNKKTNKTAVSGQRCLISSPVWSLSYPANIAWVNIKNTYVGISYICSICVLPQPGVVVCGGVLVWEEGMGGLGGAWVPGPLPSPLPVLPAQAGAPGTCAAPLGRVEVCLVSLNEKCFRTEVLIVFLKQHMTKMRS